jgi:taurine dioxygenase
MPLEIKPLSPALGAEIAGVDLRQDLPAETVAAIIDAWHEHLVILFRNQELTRSASPAISARCRSARVRPRRSTNTAIPNIRN